MEILEGILVPAANFNDYLLTVLQLLGGFPLALAILGVGVFLTVKTNFFQLRKFVFILRHTLLERAFLGKGRKEGDQAKASPGDLSSFQALTTALAATVGTGNIAGVATALSLGGPGAIFWMWVSAFFGMMLKFSEIVLAVMYRRKNRDGTIVGGPMYALAEGLGFRTGALVYALAGSLAALGIGNMVQAHTVADAVQTSLGLSPLFTVPVLAILTAAVILGGVRRVGAFTAGMVPLMTLLYTGGLLYILLANHHLLGEALGIIIKGAFCGTAPVGGFAGAGVFLAMRYGVTRGIFTNEAGLGSAAIAHAAARTAHPVKQGMWGILEVFIDTHLLCTLTALAILTTGAWAGNLEGASMTVEAFSRGLPGDGGIIVVLAIVFFSFSTLISWSYYGEKCFQFVFPRGGFYYRCFWVLFIITGAMVGLHVVWVWADLLNTLMAVPNLLALLGLSGVVVRLIRSFQCNT